MTDSGAGPAATSPAYMMMLAMIAETLTIMTRHGQTWTDGLVTYDHLNHFPSADGQVSNVSIMNTVNKWATLSHIPG